MKKIILFGIGLIALNALIYWVARTEYYRGYENGRTDLLIEQAEGLRGLVRDGEPDSVRDSEPIR